jgi:hypothetical protein
MHVYKSCAHDDAEVQCSRGCFWDDASFPSDAATSRINIMQLQLASHSPATVIIIVCRLLFMMVMHSAVCTRLCNLQISRYSMTRFQPQSSFPCRSLPVLQAGLKVPHNKPRSGTLVCHCKCHHTMTVSMAACSTAVGSHMGLWPWRLHVPTRCMLPRAVRLRRQILACHSRPLCQAGLDQVRWQLQG